MRILSSPVVYYEVKKREKISFVEAVERAQPRVLVLSFGLNGITRWSRDSEAFLRNYRALIDGILARSPNTKIILQSAYPVGENNSFAVPVGELNKQIERLNTRVSSLSKEYENGDYINASALLCDENGVLLSIYDIGDGIHLTNDAYRIILEYLVEHIQKME